MVSYEAINALFSNKTSRHRNFTIFLHSKDSYTSCFNGLMFVFNSLTSSVFDIFVFILLPAACLTKSSAYFNFYVFFLHHWFQWLATYNNLLYFYKILTLLYFVLKVHLPILKYCFRSLRNSNLRNSKLNQHNQ